MGGPEHDEIALGDVDRSLYKMHLDAVSTCFNEFQQFSTS